MHGHPGAFEPPATSAPAPNAADEVQGGYWQLALPPVYIVALNNYVPYGPASRQYKFASAALASVDRSATPWLLVLMHGAPRTTYGTPYGLFKVLGDLCFPVCVLAPCTCTAARRQRSIPINWHSQDARDIPHIPHTQQAHIPLPAAQELEEFMSFYEPLFYRAQVDMVGGLGAGAGCCTF